MRYLLTVSFLAALMTACATGDDNDKRASEPTEDPRVGDIQNQICFSRSINGFSEWDRGEGLILNRGVSDRFLVTFVGRCGALDFARAIGFEQNLATSGCIRQADRIYMSDSATGRGTTPGVPSSCLIDKIYAFDPGAEEGEAE